MSTTLYYFTGTGNTLKMAGMLASAMPDCSLKPVMGELAQVRIKGEGGLIGICFPLYFLSFPKPVMDFLDRLDIPAGTEVFAVITRGMAPMGGALSPLKRILLKKGANLKGLFYITMPNNDITLFKPDPVDVVTAKNKQLPEKISRIARTLASGRRHFDREPFGWVRPFRHKPAYLNRLKSFGSRFSADEKCNGCGICVRVCPVQNISLSKARPVWGNSCVLCEGCLNWCPSGAAQFGKVTQNKERYRCEGITFRAVEAQKKAAVDIEN